MLSLMTAPPGGCGWTLQMNHPPGPNCSLCPNHTMADLKMFPYPVPPLRGVTTSSVRVVPTRVILQLRIILCLVLFLHFLELVVIAWRLVG